MANGLSAGIGVNNSIGDLGEAISHLAGKRIGSILNKEIEDVKTVGTKTSYRGLDKGYFSSKIEMKSLVSKDEQEFDESKQKIGDFYLTSKAPKQDLVDVQIEFNTGDAMNLSIKTRKSSKSNAFKIQNELENK